jgi:hypothetical protein
MRITNNRLQDWVITFIIMMGLTCFFGLLVDPTLFEYTPENPSIFIKQKAFVLTSTFINGILSYFLTRK